tara:strand:+ start:2974 stop:3201 length:228 start_codon:yes stop_codon:yes gene_type:complete
MTNNFIQTSKGYAFIYKGITYERGLNWVSIKTCVDPNVESIIEKQGTTNSDTHLLLLADEIKSELCNKYYKNMKI